MEGSGAKGSGSVGRGGGGALREDRNGPSSVEGFEMDGLKKAGFKNIKVYIKNIRLSRGLS